jgi:hypothetical protein
VDVGKAAAVEDEGEHANVDADVEGKEIKKHVTKTIPKLKYSQQQKPHLLLHWDR